MSDGQLLGLALILAMVAAWVYLAWEVYLAPLRDEWVDLTATVDQLRADIDRETPLLDRIARDQAAVLHAEVEAVLKAAAE